MLCIRQLHQAEQMDVHSAHKAGCRVFGSAARLRESEGAVERLAGDVGVAQAVELPPPTSASMSSLHFLFHYFFGRSLGTSSCSLSCAHFSACKRQACHAGARASPVPSPLDRLRQRINPASAGSDRALSGERAPTAPPSSPHAFCGTAVAGAGRPAPGIVHPIKAWFHLRCSHCRDDAIVHGQPSSQAGLRGRTVISINVFVCMGALVQSERGARLCSLLSPVSLTIYEPPTL